MTEQTEPVVIELWTDLGCPWCYLGKHRLDTAIAARPDTDRFEIRLRSFELDPNASGAPEPIHEHLAAKYGASAAQVEAMESRIRGLAVADGLPWSDARGTANTFDIHRLLKYADAEGVGTAFFTAVQDSYFAGTLDPFNRDQLVAAGVAAGLDPDGVRSVLTGDDHADEVRADEAEAQALGASGVPFTVFGRRFATAGAQSVEGYGQVLDQTVAALDGAPVA